MGQGGMSGDRRSSSCSRAAILSAQVVLAAAMGEWTGNRVGGCCPSAIWATWSRKMTVNWRRGGQSWEIEIAHSHLCRRCPAPGARIRVCSGCAGTGKCSAAHCCPLQWPGVFACEEVALGGHRAWGSSWGLSLTQSF